MKVLKAMKGNLFQQMKKAEVWAQIDLTDKVIPIEDMNFHAELLIGFFLLFYINQEWSSSIKFW